MNKTYIIIFTGATYSQEHLAKKLNNVKDINAWFYSTPNSLFIKTTHSSSVISSYLEKEFGEHTHGVFEINTTNMWGRLPKNFWSKIKDSGTDYTLY